MTTKNDSPKMGDNRRKTRWEYLVAFMLPLVFFSGLAYWSVINQNLVSEDAILQADLARSITLTDSRFFLYPLPILFQSLLSIVSPVKESVLAPVMLSLICVSFSSLLFLYSLKQSGLPISYRWLLLLGWLTNPVVVLESVNGSGLMVTMLIYMALFAGFSSWLQSYTWKPLAFLGFAGTVAAMTHLNMIVFLVLPVLGVALSAFLHEPKNINFSEHAFWLIVTPVAYSIIIRLFFSEIIYQNPFSFIKLDTLFPQTLPLAFPSLTSISAYGLFLHILDWVWIIAPLLIPLTAFYILTSALRVRPSSAIFVGMAWLPLAFSLISDNFQPLSSPNRFILLLVPSIAFIIVVLIRTISFGKKMAALLLAILLLASNVLTLLNFKFLPDGSEYKTYLTTWSASFMQDEESGKPTLD